VSGKLATRHAWLAPRCAGWQVAGLALSESPIVAERTGPWSPPAGSAILELMSWLYCLPVGLVLRAWPRASRLRFARAFLHRIHRGVRFDTLQRLT